MQFHYCFKAKKFSKSKIPHIIPHTKTFLFPKENEEYENEIESKRHGSHKDVSNLISLFKKLKFKILYKKNLTRYNFYKELEHFQDNPEHRSANMMILGDNFKIKLKYFLVPIGNNNNFLVLLSHGRENELIAVDGLSIQLETIFEKFNNINCPMLAGKPKFFIIQACRGYKTDRLFPESGSSGSTTIGQKI